MFSMTPKKKFERPIKMRPQKTSVVAWNFSIRRVTYGDMRTEETEKAAKIRPT